MAVIIKTLYFQECFAHVFLILQSCMMDDGFKAPRHAKRVVYIPLVHLPLNAIVSFMAAVLDISIKLYFVQ